MAHKVHPKSFRIRRNDDWSSRGFYKKNIPTYLKEDFEIRNFLKKALEKVGLEKVEIERFPKKTKVVIFTSRPGLVIGRGGEGVEKLKKDLFKNLSKKMARKIGEGEIGLEIKEVRNPWLSAPLSVDWAAQQLERRVRHKKVLKQVLDKVMANREVLGARIELSGRLNGVEIARREWLQKGNLPRHTIRADIDYSQGIAKCSYGVIGIKVWIYKGEKFE